MCVHACVRMRMRSTSNDHLLMHFHPPQNRKCDAMEQTNKAINYNTYELNELPKMFMLRMKADTRGAIERIQHLICALLFLCVENT